MKLVILYLFLNLATSTYLIADEKKSEQSGKPIPVEEIIKNVFKDSKNKQECLRVLPNKARNYQDIDPQLDASIDTLLKGLNTNDDEVLKPLFHPRLKIKSKEIKGVLASFWASYGKKYQASIFRLLALKNTEDTPEPISCKDQNFSALAQYGHKLQFSTIIQITGSKELGRLYATFVPYKGKWRLGAFHSWQWTYLQKDHQAWVEEALEEKKSKRPDYALVKLDVAKKLIDGSPYYNNNLTAEYDLIARDVLGKEKVIQSFFDDIKPKNAIYFGTSLSSYGLGLLIRFRIEKELSSVALRQYCGEVYDQLIKSRPWIKELAGLYCGFLLPVEQDTSKDGVLGGFLHKPAAS